MTDRTPDSQPSPVLQSQTLSHVRDCPSCGWHRRILERMTEVVWSMDARTQIVQSLNRAGERLYGRTLEEFQQHPNLWIDIVHPDDRERVRSILQNLPETEAVIEYRILRPDGEERRVSSQVWKVTDRETEYLESLTIDLTDYRQTQQKKLQFENLAANLPGVIYRYRLRPDGSHEFSYMSPGTRQVYELEPQDIENDANTVWNLIHPDDIAEFRNSVARSIQTQTTWKHQWRSYTASGKLKWLTGISQPEIQDNGETIWDGLLFDITDRKHEELERKRFTEIIDNTTDLIGTADLDGNILYFNQGGRQLTGLTPDEDVTGFHIRQFHPPEVTEFLLGEAIPLALKQGIWQGETALLHRDGRMIPVSQVLIAHQSPEGNVCYLSSMMRDISEAKASEKRLKQQEQFLRTIYDNIGNLVFVIDVGEDGEFRYGGWNSLSESYTGLTAEQVYGKTPYELLGDEMGTVVRQNYLNCILQGSTVTYEEYLSFQGTRYCFQTVLTPLFDGKGTIERIIGTGTDITDRKNAELALQESEARYRSLARQEHLVNSIARQIRQSLDLESILQTTVREVRALLAVDRCFFLWYRPTEKPFFELVSEDKEPDLPCRIGCYPLELVRPVGDIVLKRKRLCIDDTHELADLSLKNTLRAFDYRSIFFIPIQTENGELGVLGCTRERQPQPWPEEAIELIEVVCDRLAIAIQQGCLYQQSREAERQATAKSQELERALRKLQTTQAQLVQAEKMSSLGQLVAGVAHEINNPISFVFGNSIHAQEYTNDLLHLLDLYRQTYPPTAEIEALTETIDLDYLVEDLPKLFKSIQSGATRVREIVRSLRTFSRLDEAEEKAIDLHESLDSTLTILGNRLRSTGDNSEIQVVKRYGDLPHIDCYAGQLNQVLMNVLVNAIDALEKCRNSGEEATITLETAVTADERVRLKVSDNGTGMTPEVLDRIFDPFYTTKPIGKGTGLGLSVSYQIIVDRHGGSLDCHSVVGEGTTFIVEIPVRQSHFG
ncbi:MAG: PAS domain S-box protein [Cyanobacteria bacterium SBC]|nr:PAS domain S-box protein [Cyanobacteria bacterium SBC]